ncbi:MAG: hypothetical protein OXD30_08510 [Bryobacterales bacterium]|nr:hypothetical protein [Bryobacterales bacterium]
MIVRVNTGSLVLEAGDGEPFDLQPCANPCHAPGRANGHRAHPRPAQDR